MSGGDFAPEPDRGILDALERALRDHPPRLQGEAAICTGFVIVAEWAAVGGTRWLSRTYSPNLTTWHRDGFLHEALYNWPDAEG